MRNYRIIFGVLIAALAVLFIIPGCKKGSENPLAWKEGGKVLAQCGDVKITENEFEDALLSVNMERREQMKKHPGLTADFVGRLLHLKLATLKAKEKGYDSIEEFSEKKKEIDAMYSIQMKAALQEMLIEKEIIEKIIITDQEALDYYKQNAIVWERIEVSEIFIKVPENPTEQIIKEKLSLANKIYEDLVAGKIAWETAVQKYSDSSSVIKERNGERGMIHRRSRKLPSTQMTLEAFSLQNEGDFTKPISDKTGYYIIKLDKKISFDEQKEQIKKVMSSERVRTDRQNYLDGLKTAPFEFFIEGYDPNKPLIQTKPKTE